MKKIFLFSVCALLLVDNVFATCGQSTLGFDGAQKPQHDEFLYINKKQYDLTVSGYENSNRQTSGSGYGYECDTTRSAGCDKGDEVTLPAGHFFEGKVVNQSVKYICRSGYGFNDHWEAQKGTEDACDTKFGKISVGEQLDGKTTVDCSGISKTEENVNLVKTWAVLCRPGRTVVCKPTECVKDYKVNKTTDKCDFIGGKNDCPQSSRHPKKRTKIPGTNNYYDVTECVDTGMIDCYERIQEGLNAYWDGLSCVTCKKGEVPDHKNAKCVKGQSNPKNTCADMYNGYPERIKCCEAGKATKWTGSVSSGTCSCVDTSKEWKDGKCLCKRYNVDGVEIPLRPALDKSNGVQCIPNIHLLEAKCCVKSGWTWIANDAEELEGHCDCGSGKKFHFKPQEQKCECIPGDGDNSTPIPTGCTKTECEITINQNVKCSYNNNYLNSTEIYSVCKEDLDARNLNCDGLKAKVSSCTDTECIRNWLTRIDAYDKLIEKVCGGSGVVTTPVPDNGAEILAAENTLTSFFRNAESDASVWKDKDGNFNTARLASDLTAGVILGTVGGVVSGVVIKKKQVEKGFDALHCTVGGQTVADWGDIFNVGLRR